MSVKFTGSFKNSQPIFITREGKYSVTLIAVDCVDNDKGGYTLLTYRRTDSAQTYKVCVFENNQYSFCVDAINAGLASEGMNFEQCVRSLAENEELVLYISPWQTETASGFNYTFTMPTPKAKPQATVEASALPFN